MKKADCTEHFETYWTTKEVAVRLRKSDECIKKWLATGRLKRTKAGHGTLISETDLQAFLQRSTEEAAA